MFESHRLSITATQTMDMRHGVPFYLDVNDPSRVTYACLIGIGSVTHHFDYGQRYVELMATQATGSGNIKVLPPPLKAMAPVGYYLLFAVELRGSIAIPSKGVFVKLVI